jgi:hypothetical protein
VEVVRRRPRLLSGLTDRGGISRMMAEIDDFSDIFE